MTALRIMGRVCLWMGVTCLIVVVAIVRAFVHAVPGEG